MLKAPKTPSREVGDFLHLRRAALRRQRLSFFEELQRGGVEAIARTRRPRPVVKDVSEMSIASRTGNFRAVHSVALVDALNDVVRIEWSVETRPTGSRLELVGAGK